MQASSSIDGPTAHAAVRSAAQIFSGLSDDETELLGQADRFARAELYPLSQRMDDEEWWPAEAFAKIGANGYFGITAPEALGGSGADLFASGLVLEAFARWNHALALSWVAHENLCLHNLLRNADAEQKSRYVPALCSGKSVGALGLTEPGAGSDAIGSMRTSARLDGMDYVLNGTKMYITNGAVADVVLVYAKTDPARGSKGISAFIVEKGMPGFSVAQKLRKMGFRGSQTAELVFDDCRVPAANLIGGENAGVKVVMSGLDLERAMIAPICLGIAERALELSLDYARTRKQFGEPIASFQMIQDKLAQMYVWVESMRLFTYQALRAASALEHGEVGRGEIHKLTAASVMFAAATLNSVLDQAVQIHGGSGYIWESEVNRLYRSIKLLEIGAGTTEIRKLIISGEMLRG
ncbi:MAG TPA: acyl-CoA dehydrogenase family protein [Caldimonas sp.]|jgi:isovaleryl-CoA dehydrogenase